MTLTYDQFLRNKVDFDKTYGTPVNQSELNPALKQHQSKIVQWAAEGGRRAIFASWGLGKTGIQLETARLLLNHGADRALIVCPLNVRQEFIHDATEVLGMPTPRFIRTNDQINKPGIYLTNYESVRDGKLDPNLFDVTSLDEAAILRSYGSVTYQTFLTLFDKVPYRFVATATPSPNRYKELIHYAAFLGIMDSGDALTRWFQRDSTKANNLTLYPHRAAEFWAWLSSWSVWLNSPADIGCDATGYVLPDLKVVYHEVSVDHSKANADRDGQNYLFRGGALGVKDVAREKRLTMADRVNATMHLVTGYLKADPTDQIIVWVDLNDEQDAIEQHLAAQGISCSSVHGALSTEESERRVSDWKDRRTRVLLAKPVMLGAGVNLQQSNKTIFAGVTYRFHDTIQALHRIQRFGQTRPCVAHIIHAESEREVVREFNRKWRDHEELTTTMTDIIREHGLSTLGAVNNLTRTIGVERVEESGNGWLAARNDCVPETTDMDDNSVDLIVTSIPFSNHYQYTSCYEDFGDTESNEHFWAQMDYLTPQLLRVLNPGRLYCCHVKDRILFGSVTGAGAPTVSPFHAEAIMHGRKHSFDYLGMITVVTDVVRENNQTYRLGWTENSKDSTKMGVGSPEYILLFRKPQTDRTKGYADKPVTKLKGIPADHDCLSCPTCDEHCGCYDNDCCQRQLVYTRARWQLDAHAFYRESGNRLLTPDELAALPADQMSTLFTDQTLRNIYDYEHHITTGEALEQRGSLPATFMSLAPGSWHPDVWHDINRMDTLNTEQSRRAQQMHVCPLQLGLIKRLIVRYSNPGELVYDPFGGIMSVPLVALQEGRRGRGVELNPDYFRDGVAYLRAHDRKVGMPTLFDLMALEEAAKAS